MSKRSSGKKHAKTILLYKLKGNLMKIDLHENGWTVVVSDTDIKNVTQDEITILAKYLLTNTVVVIKNQKLDPIDQVKICEMFGETQTYNHAQFNQNFVLPNSNDKVIRVTGELNEHGQPGMFGHVSELEWHCNRVSDPDRRPIVWLYAERGTKGSKTSWLNNILSYHDLPDAFKDEIKNLKLNVGNVQQFANYYYGKDYVPQDIKYYRPSLVHTNDLGVTGLFFSWNQVHFIEEMPPEKGRELIEILRKHCENSKYIYDHEWEDGDIVISDQWLSIHKRWEFEHMDKRVLHRLACDYSKINLDK